MKKIRVLLIGASLVVVAIAVILFVMDPWNIVSSNKTASQHGKHSHSHANLDPVEAKKPYPTLDVSLKTKNDKRILDLDTKNFVFKSAVDTRVKGPNKGHAHLNVDGESFAMFYSDSYVLPDFMPGEYTLKVTLNAKETHAPLAVNGNTLSDTILLSVEADSENHE